MVVYASLIPDLDDMFRSVNNQEFYSNASSEDFILLKVVLQQKLLIRLVNYSEEGKVCQASYPK